MKPWRTLVNMLSLLVLSSTFAGEPDESQLNAYFRLPLTPAVDNADDIVAKTQALSQVAQSLFPISKSKAPAAAMASFNLGRAYEDFAAEWNSLRAPPFLNQQAAAEFGVQATTTALPFCQQARDAYVAALATADLPPAQQKIASERAQALDPAQVGPLNSDRLNGEIVEFLSHHSANAVKTDRAAPMETLSTSWGSVEVRTCRLAKNW